MAVLYAVKIRKDTGLSTYDTTLLFGLDGVEVTSVTVDAAGGRTVRVVTAADMPAGCPDCGVESTSVKGWVLTRPRDVAHGDDAIAVLWRKRRWRCRQVACERATFTESIPQVPSGARLTGRLREHAAGLVADDLSVAAAARRCAMSWPSVHRSFVARADAVLGEPEPVAVLGIDETRRGKARWAQDPVTGRWALLHKWETGFVDLSGIGGLLGQANGRTKATVTGWLADRGSGFTDTITHVAIDPAAVYASAVREALPHAVIVVDHFHLVQLANRAVDGVRRRVTAEHRGRRGRKIDPEWRMRRRLLTAREHLDDERFTRMWNTLIDAPGGGQVLAAWIAKEELRKLLALARTGAGRHQIGQARFAFADWCAHHTHIAEVVTLAETIDTWWPEIEAFISTGITNARTEGLNRVVKQVNRIACGFRNPTNQRRRVRYACTRQSRRSQPDR